MAKWKTGSNKAASKPNIIPKPKSQRRQSVGQQGVNDTKKVVPGVGDRKNGKKKTAWPASGPRRGLLA